MQSVPRIMVVGRSTVDVLLPGVRGFAAADGLGTLGEYELQPGGSGLNTAIALSFLGADVTLATRVGTDRAARLVRSELESRSIRLARLGEDPVLRTSFSLISIAEDSRIGILHHEGASRSLGPEDVSETALARCGSVHVAGALFMESFDGRPAAELLRRARQAGKRTSLGTSRNTDRGRLLDPVFPHLDLLVMNEKEGLEITGAPDVDTAIDRFHEQGVREVVLTLGPDGAHVSGRGFRGTVPALGVEPVDTTGCGDAFVAGYLDATVRGLPAEVCARWGNAVGGHCARTLGAICRPFERAEIEALSELQGEAGDVAGLVLAGGRSRRMEGVDQKLEIPVAGRPMVARVVDSLRRAGVPRIVALLGHEAHAVRAALRDHPVELFRADDHQRGTGASLRAAVEAHGDLPRRLIVVNGDTPLVRPASLRRLVRRQLDTGAGAVVYTATSSDPERYGHAFVQRSEGGGLGGIEHFEERSGEADAAEVNTGTYCFDRDALRDAASELGVAEDGEHHLSDILPLLQRRGAGVELLHHPDFREFISVNTREHLREVEDLLASGEIDRGMES